MITRIEYQSDDCRRLATVLYVKPKRWSVLVRIVNANLAPTYIRSCFRESLTGYQPNGGGFNNALSRLRTLELIQGRGELRASEELFA